MHILLVGGTGVLGRAALPRLIAAGHDLTVVSRRAETDAEIARAGGRPIRIEPTQTTDLRRAVGDIAPDAIVRLATNIPTGPGAALRRRWRTNDVLRRDVAAVLARAAIDVGARYVGESIVLAYADGAARWLGEDAPQEAVGPVSTVADADAAAASVAATGLPGVSLRFGLFHGVGTGQSEESLAMARRGWFAVPGPGTAYLSFVALHDAATAVVASLGLPSGAYNVVEDDPATRAEHARALGALAGRRVRPLPRLAGAIPSARPVARSLRVDNTRLRAHGWRPTTPRTVEAWGTIAREVDRAAA